MARLYEFLGSTRFLTTLAQGSPAKVQWWSSAPFVVTLAVVSALSLLFGVWALMLAYRPRPIVRQIGYLVESNNLIDSRVFEESMIEVTVGGHHRLDRLTLTSVVLANVGKASIAGSDLQPGRSGMPPNIVFDPIGRLMELGVDQIVVARVRTGDVSSLHVGASLTSVVLDGRSMWSLDFNILEAGDTISVQILHNGPSLDDFELIGHLRDGQVRQARESTSQVFALALIETTRMSAALAPPTGQIVSLVGAMAKLAQRIWRRIK